MDVYLITGCISQPALGGFAALLGPSAVGLAARVMEHRPGFLGLDLAANEAQALLAQCRQAGARGSAVAAGYRTRQAVTMEQAMAVAERELDLGVARHRAAVVFEPIRFVREEALWWVFCRPSEALIEAGVVPGALYVAVDKLDAHVWSESAQAEFLQAA